MVIPKIIYIRVTCLTQSFSFLQVQKSVASFYSAPIFVVACLLTSEVGNPLPLQVWSPLEMSHCKRLSQDCGVCQCVPENTCQWCEGHGGIFAFFWFRSWKIEVLRKFWKRQCVEKLQGIETETPRRIISSVEDEPSMKVVILGGIRFPLL